MNSALKSRQYAAGYTAWRAMRAKENLSARAEDDALEIGELGRHLGYFVRRLQVCHIQRFYSHSRTS